MREIYGNIQKNSADIPSNPNKFGHVETSVTIPCLWPIPVCGSDNINTQTINNIHAQFTNSCIY